MLTADLTSKHGWAHHSLNLLRALREHPGIKLTVIAARNTPPDDEFSALPLLPSIEPRDSSFLMKLWQSRSTVRDALKDCDLIHTTVEPYAPLAAWVAGKRPLVITGHGSYVNLPCVRRFPVGVLYGWAFKRGTMICVSHYTESVVKSVVNHQRTVVVNNGVDATRFENLPQPDPPVTRPTVLTVGGVKKRKGTLPLVRAMAKVRERIPNVQCMVLGSTTTEPETTAQVQAEITRLQLEDCVTLAGFVDEDTLLGWYGAADVFVLPSINDGWKFEGFGLVHLEASAAGLPVIGTRGCGVEDAIDHWKTGLLLDQDKIDEQLPNIITTLLQDNNLRERLQVAGQQKARSMTWTKTASETVRVYASEVRGVQ